jgi:hypothetical protein
MYLPVCGVDAELSTQRIEGRVRVRLGVPRHALVSIASLVLRVVSKAHHLGIDRNMIKGRIVENEALVDRL